MLWWVRRQLKSESAEVRLKAVATVAASHPKDAPAVLAEVLGSDPDKEVRAAAALALANLGTQECIQRLSEAAALADSHTRLCAIQSLGQTGKGDSGVFIKALADDFWPVREKAMRALLALKWRPTAEAHRTLAQIVEALDSPYNQGEDVRVASWITKLGPLANECLSVMMRSQRRLHLATLVIGRNLESSSDREALLAGLQSPHWEIRKGAAVGMKRSPDPAFVTPLIDALDDPDKSLLEYTMPALAATGDRRGLTALLRCLLLNHNSHAARALGQLAEPADPVVAEALAIVSASHNDVSRVCRDILGKWGDPRAEKVPDADLLRQAEPLFAARITKMFEDRLRELAGGSARVSDPQRWTLPDKDSVPSQGARGPVLEGFAPGIWELVLSDSEEARRGIAGVASKYGLPQHAVYQTLLLEHGGRVTIAARAFEALMRLNHFADWLFYVRAAEGPPPELPPLPFLVAMEAFESVAECIILSRAYPCPLLSAAISATLDS
jgi:HEAT repeat protein